MFTKDASFWKHEWLKHGTCSETLCPLLNDEHAFFFAVLALNKMYDLNVCSSLQLTWHLYHKIPPGWVLCAPMQGSLSQDALERPRTGNICMTPNIHPRC